MGAYDYEVIMCSARVGSPGRHPRYDVGQWVYGCRGGGRNPWSSGAQTAPQASPVSYGWPNFPQSPKGLTMQEVLYKRVHVGGIPRYVRGDRSRVVCGIRC